MYFRSRLLVKECSPNRLHFFLGIIVLFVDPVSYCRVSQAQEFTPFQKHDPPEFTTALIKDGTLRFTELGEALDYRTEVVEIIRRFAARAAAAIKVPSISKPPKTESSKTKKNTQNITKLYKNQRQLQTTIIFLLWCIYYFYFACALLCSITIYYLYLSVYILAFDLMGNLGKVKFDVLKNQVQDLRDPQ